jgi:hypothetical protein
LDIFPHFIHKFLSYFIVIFLNNQGIETKHYLSLKKYKKNYFGPNFVIESLIYPIPIGFFNFMFFYDIYGFIIIKWVIFHSFLRFILIFITVVLDKNNYIAEFSFMKIFLFKIIKIFLVMVSKNKTGRSTTRRDLKIVDNILPLFSIANLLMLNDYVKSTTFCDKFI